MGGAKPAKPAEDDFYQVIITNNLFRPLGYRKPSPPPPYQLIATVINHGKATNKALLRRRKDGRMYYVGLGEVFGGAKVERIEPRSVTLLIGGQSMKFRAAADCFITEIIPLAETVTRGSDGGFQSGGLVTSSGYGLKCVRDVEDAGTRLRRFVWRNYRRRFCKHPNQDDRHRKNSVIGEVDGVVVCS